MVRSSSLFSQVLGLISRMGFAKDGFASKVEYHPTAVGGFKNKLLSIDASMIELCVTMFDWAKYQQTKGAVKLHLLLDHAGYLPTFALSTEG